MLVLMGLAYGSPRGTAGESYGDEAENDAAKRGNDEGVLGVSAERGASLRGSLVARASRPVECECRGATA